MSLSYLMQTNVNNGSNVSWVHFAYFSCCSLKFLNLTESSHCHVGLPQVGNVKRSF